MCSRFPSVGGGHCRGVRIGVAAATAVGLESRDTYSPLDSLSLELDDHHGRGGIVERAWNHQERASIFYFGFDGDAVREAIGAPDPVLHGGPGGRPPRPPRKGEEMGPRCGADPPLLD